MSEIGECLNVLGCGNGHGMNHPDVAKYQASLKKI